MSRSTGWIIASLAVAMAACDAKADIADYAGQWALHRTVGAGWLELKLDGDRLVGSLLWGGGSVVPLSDVICDDDRVVLVRSRQVRRKDGTSVTASTRWEVRFQAGQLVGRTIPSNPSAPVEEFVGKRLPGPGPAPDLASLKYGEPIELFNGRDLSGWKLTNENQRNGFKAIDGVLVNDPIQPHGGPHISYGNLMTEQKFEDFRLTLEVNVPPGSNSGVYLRGIYEIQISDSFGHPLDSHNMGALYSRITPAVAAEKPAGQWQTLDITLCKRHLTVILNGKKIIDNQPVEGVTGGALTADEFSPGPIYLQGDHGKVMYRNIVLRPILEE